MMNAKQPFDLVLFDLGGVIIELSGVQQMLAWASHLGSGDRLWRQWLSSRTVRDFESGRSSAGRFADEMIAEFNLPVSSEQFLTEFIRWPKGPYVGAETMLKKLSQHFSLGILSNTNELHWRRFNSEMNFIRFFEWTFPSHLTGRLKPDKDAFRHVTQTSGFPPERILFFDDNQINVDGAKAVGMRGYTVSGVSGTTRKLSDLGLLDSQLWNQIQTTCLCT